MQAYKLAPKVPDNQQGLSDKSFDKLSARKSAVRRLVLLRDIQAVLCN